jgi:hypothetical protein
MYVVAIINVLREEVITIRQTVNAAMSSIHIRGSSCYDATPCYCRRWRWRISIIAVSTHPHAKFKSTYLV